MQDGLVLRDLHRPPAPSLWPPAPGWWILGIVVLVTLAVLVAVRSRRARRRDAALALFDASFADGLSPSARLARASELLRRAARRVRADADRLEGDAWLGFLDRPATRFVEGPGRLLLDGPFRPDVASADADAAVELARKRFVELMMRSR